MNTYRKTIGVSGTLMGIVLLALSGLLPARAQTDQRCFAETSYCIAGRIHEFWEQNGGLPVFGLPITPQQQQTIGGQPLQVQWFERNRLELHPENPRPYDVQLGRLGADLLEKQGRDWFSFPKGSQQPGCRYFAETGQSICGDFLATWQANGLELDGVRGTSEAESLALTGMPLSEAQTERLSDGNDYTVQWFERARFEYHPENTPPYNVQIGLLGREMEPPLTGGGVVVPVAPPGDCTYRIAFYSMRDGNSEIYVMNEDGSNQTRITDNNTGDAHPAWSPDGSRIAFESKRDGNWEIYVMNADGSNQTRLTDNDVDDRWPAWSPCIPLPTPTPVPTRVPPPPTRVPPPPPTSTPVPPTPTPDIPMPTIEPT